MTAPTPYDNPITLRDRLIFPALRDAYWAGVEAVTAERNQAVRELAEQKRINTSNLRTMTVHLDQARQMLADAPHAEDCTFLTYEPNSCTCWKAGL